MLIAGLLFGAEPIAPGSSGKCSGAFLHGGGGVVTISKFDLGDGQPHDVFVDFRTGYIRILSEADGQFTAGPTLVSDAPVELYADCNGDDLHWQVSKSSAEQAHRIVIRQENVRFKSDDVNLEGTLYLPQGPPPYPAVVLLHGSGPLSRYSFGPIPHFFAAAGLAVLTYDKRGTGQSTGSFDTATFDQLAEDGASAV